MLIDGPVGSRQLLQGINLTVKSGEIHALMGPNGAGKTTLAMSLMGNNKFKGQSLEFKVNGDDLSKLKPEERARKGLFIAFQQPVEFEGVSVFSFLRASYNAIYPSKKVPLDQFKSKIKKIFTQVSLSEDFIKRSVNEGFSGGEKKRFEIAQLLLLKPKFAILDEIDSGLDVDNLKIMVKTIKDLVQEYQMGIILITHNPRIFHYLNPDVVHVLTEGRIKKSGNKNLIATIEEKGYAAV